MFTAGPLYVWTDAFGQAQLVGAATVIGEHPPGRVPGQFVYDERYVSGGAGYSLDPANLPMAMRRHTLVSFTGFPAALLDAGPDDWGRRVLGAMKRPPQGEREHLLASRGTGVGALLFSLSRDAVKSREPALELQDLEPALASADAVERRRPLSENALRLLAAGGTLGGARPKVAVRDAEGCWIAKFPSNNDAVDQPLIEYASLELARAAGIDAAQARLLTVGDKNTLLVRRFDVDAQGGRTPYLSMFAAIANGQPLSEQRTRHDYSYPGLAGFLTKFGAEVVGDRRELFRRMCFNLMLGHTDDHSRNHGFLLAAPNDTSWRLSPAFDIAPSNGEALALARQAEVQAIGVGVAGRERSLQNLFSATGAFGLSHDEAVVEYERTVGTVQRWREQFAAAGVNGHDLARMEHRVLAPDIDWQAVPSAAPVAAKRRRPRPGR